MLVFCSLPIISPNKATGFTLVEILVVIVIVALASGAAVVGFNSVFARKLDSEAEKMGDWLEAVAESAVFQSSVLGVRGEGNSFRVVAYYDSRWFHLNDIESFELLEEVQWDIETEDLVEFGQSQVDRDQEREPFVAFLPSGQALPAGTLNLHFPGQDSLSVNWDVNADFIVGATEDEL